MPQRNPTHGSRFETVAFLFPQFFLLAMQFSAAKLCMIQKIT